MTFSVVDLNYSFSLFLGISSFLRALWCINTILSIKHSTLLSFTTASFILCNIPINISINICDGYQHIQRSTVLIPHTVVVESDFLRVVLPESPKKKYENQENCIFYVFSSPVSWKLCVSHSAHSALSKCAMARIALHQDLTLG